MFPQIIRSTQLHASCLQQSRKKKTGYDCLFFGKKNKLQGACEDVFTRPWLGFHVCTTLRRPQNNRNVGTCSGKSLTGFKLYATSANIAVVPCKRTQQVTTLLGPTMLGVVGQHVLRPFAWAFREVEVTDMLPSLFLIITTSQQCEGNLRLGFM